MALEEQAWKSLAFSEILNFDSTLIEILPTGVVCQYGGIILAGVDSTAEDWALLVQDQSGTNNVARYASLNFTADDQFLRGLQGVETIDGLQLVLTNNQVAGETMVGNIYYRIIHQ